MDTLTEEFPVKESSSILNNGMTPSNTKNVPLNNGLSSLDEEDNYKKSDISSTTPLLVFSSPDDELSEKLTKLSSAPAYNRGFSGTFDYVYKTKNI